MWRSGSPIEDQVSAQVDLTLSRITADLASVVKELLAPLFAMFDFAEFSDSVYNQVVDGFVKAAENEIPAHAQSEGFRADLGSYRLFVERLGNAWLARVYDLRKHATIFEGEKETLDLAKQETIAVALLNLGSSAPTKEIEWEAYKPLS